MLVAAREGEGEEVMEVKQLLKDCALVFGLWVVQSSAIRLGMMLIAREPMGWKDVLLVQDLVGAAIISVMVGLLIFLFSLKKDSSSA